jgi:hypothetical protein
MEKIVDVFLKLLELTIYFAMVVFYMVMSALPIAIAILIVIWFLNL